jgi:hypothetical protein
VARKKHIRLECETLEYRVVPAANFSQFVDPHPALGNAFGARVLPLSTGNIVTTSPLDDAGGTDAGAVYLFNSATGALISTLTGSHANDQVGSGGITVLNNGNYIIDSPNWDCPTEVDVGAVTWASGTNGVSGIIDSTKSLAGNSANDHVGSNGVKQLSNGNFVIISPGWHSTTLGFGPSDHCQKRIRSQYSVGAGHAYLRSF